MKGFRRGIAIVRDTANVEPYLQLGTTDIVTLDIGGAVSLVANSTTQNAMTFLNLTVPDGTVTVELSVLSIWVAYKYSFVASTTTGVWERLLPCTEMRNDPVTRNIDVYVLKSATALSFRLVHITSAGGSVSTDLQFHAKVSGRLLTFTMPNTTAFVAAATAVAATSNVSQLMDKTTLIHNEIAQVQSKNHYGTTGIGKIQRRLNAGSFTALASNTDTAVHIVLEVPTSKSLHIVKIEGSIWDSFVTKQVPLTSTCSAHLIAANNLFAQTHFVGSSNDYQFTFYIATIGANAGKLVLKLTSFNLFDCSFFVDTISGGLGTGNAMKVTNIVSNQNVNL